MSTFAIAALIDHAVRGMPAEEGFPERRRVGGLHLPGRRQAAIRSGSASAWTTSPASAARESFTARFERLRSRRHRFFEMDYLRYFEEVHGSRSGVYMYDGDHFLRARLRRPAGGGASFAPGCLVLVDDTNREDPHRATLDFIAGSGVIIAYCSI